MKNVILFIILLLSLLFSCNNKTKVNDSSNQVMDTINMNANLMEDSVQDIMTKQKGVTLEILSSTVQLKNDTLYFNYKVSNNSSRNLFFYHLQLLSYSLELNIDTENIFPKCNIIILDRNGNVPTLIARTGGVKKYEPTEYSLNSFIMMQSNNSQLFERRFYIGDLVLNAGEYKFILQYYSPHNEYYLMRFKDKQKKTVNLKNYELFEGVLKSNTCSFFVKENE